MTHALIKELRDDFTSPLNLDDYSRMYPRDNPKDRGPDRVDYFGLKLGEPSTEPYRYQPVEGSAQTITTEEGVTVSFTPECDCSDPKSPSPFCEVHGIQLSQPAEQPAVGVDPKGAAGAAKLPLDVLPWAVIAEASIGMGEGATKYGPHNWRTSGGVETMTYVAAAQRHLLAFILGEDIDAYSGLHHITKAISSLMVVRDAQIHGTAHDNRPLAAAPGLMDQLNAQWTETRERTLNNLKG